MERLQRNLRQPEFNQISYAFNSIPFGHWRAVLNGKKSFVKLASQNSGRPWPLFWVQLDVLEQRKTLSEADQGKTLYFEDESAATRTMRKDTEMLLSIGPRTTGNGRLDRDRCGIGIGENPFPTSRIWTGFLRRTDIYQ